MALIIHDAAPTSRAHTTAIRMTFLLPVVVAAAMGGLLFGWDWVVIGGAKPFFERYFGIAADPASSGWVNSCALLGCFVGAMIGGPLSDRIGRRKPLMLAALLFAATSLGNALSGSFSTFVTWRILGGVAIGLASGLSPLYIAELAPANIRGRLVAINQLTIVVGVLGAQLVNWALVHDLPADASDRFIAASWFGQTAWRWMFGVLVVPSALFFVGMLFAPESPRWLAQRSRVEEARNLLRRIGGSGYADAALLEISGSSRADEGKSGWRELLSPGVRRALVIGITIAVFQQWCGINVIFNYAEEIFRAAGFDISKVLSNIAWTGSVNLVFTLVALKLVDSAGRRPLMLLGAGSLAVIYTLMAIAFALGVAGVPVLILVLVAIAAYAVTLAPVTWIVIAEIFPTRVRGAAMSVAVGALWLACFALTYTFPLLNARMGPAGVFLLYALVCVAGLVFIARNLTETKGRTLEELEKRLVSRAD